MIYALECPYKLYEWVRALRLAPIFGYSLDIV